MKAYVIFSGGGAKGLAFTGCMRAMEELEIKPVAYGGVSVGSIFAYLASIGYKGNELFIETKAKNLHKKFQIKAVAPSKIIDDIDNTLKTRKNQSTFFKNLSSMFSIRSAMTQISRHEENLSKLFMEYGIIDTSDVLETINELSRIKLPGSDFNNIRFSDLDGPNNPLLKIVSSNITKLTSNISSPDSPDTNKISTSIQSSIAFPILFKPIQHENEYYVDGGLTSNAPSFIFQREFRDMPYPILLFNLFPNRGMYNSIHNFSTYLKNLLSTALGASDKLLLNSNPALEIAIESTIDTFPDTISDSDLERMDELGYETTMQFFSRHDDDRKPFGLNLLKNFGKARSPQEQLQFYYGDKGSYTNALWGLARQIEDISNAKDIRSQIMLPTDHRKKEKMVVYTFNFKAEDLDKELILSYYGGCTGRCLELKKAVWADMEIAQKEHLNLWNMTEEQQRMVRTDRKSMLSVPIFDHEAPIFLSEETDLSQYQTMGTLSIDSSTPLRETGWIHDESDNNGQPLLNEIVQSIMFSWSELVSKLLKDRWLNYVCKERQEIESYGSTSAK